LTIGVGCVAALSIAGCGNATTAQKAPAAAVVRVHGRLVSPPANLLPRKSKVTIHARLVSPPVQLLPQTSSKLTLRPRLISPPVQLLPGRGTIPRVVTPKPVLVWSPVRSSR
jgi:hypothetical protein